VGFVVVGIAAVLIIGFGALVHRWGKRDFAGSRSEVSAEARPELDGRARPSEASVESGEYGVASSAHALRNWNP
jgi:hypothetical protein